MKTAIYVFIFLCFASIVSAQQQLAAKVVLSKVTEKEIAKTTPIVGIVDFDKFSYVTSEISGLIKNSFLEEGTFVEQGKALIQLENDFTQKDIEIMQTRIEELEIQLEESGKNLQRLEKLFKNSASSEKEYDDYSFTHRKLLKQKETLLKELEKLNLNFAKSTVKAPFSGIIIKKMKEQGEWIDPGTPICSIGSTEDTVIKVAVSESLIKYIHLAEEVTIKIKSLDKEFKGTIINYTPEADIKSKTFHIKIKIPFFENAIRNMSATAYVPISEKMKITMVKRNALIRYQGKNFVYTINNNTAQIIPVEVVVYNGENLGVSSPYIVPDMPVVVEGNDRLQPGQSVEILGEK